MPAIRRGRDAAFARTPYVVPEPTTGRRSAAADGRAAFTRWRGRARASKRILILAGLFAWAIGAHVPCASAASAAVVAVSDDTHGDGGVRALGPFYPTAIRAAVEETEGDAELTPYPAFRAELIALVRRKAQEVRPLDINARAADLLGGRGRPAVAFEPQEVQTFWRACSQDPVSILRAMALIARVVHRMDVVFYMNGSDMRAAFDDNGLESGFAMPVANLAMFAYIPDASRKEPDFQCRFLAVYERSYVHSPPQEVVSATLRIGSGDTAPFQNPWDASAPVISGHIVEGDMIYGAHGVGAVGIRGVAGRKRGFVGALQRVLFFLPEAITGMVLRDGDLYIDALVDQRIEDFESSGYAVHAREPDRSSWRR